MKAAQSLLELAQREGVRACFANPGTSEMHLVAALDAVPGIRPVLCLFEGVATGAADGYGRMMQAPALTLLHLGPGLGNGLANLHNAYRAKTPIVSLIGEHATYHRANNPPLASDITALARPVSTWVRTAETTVDLLRLTQEAFAAARRLGPAALILPADIAWSDDALALPSAEAAADERFEKIWVAYPKDRQRGKAACLARIAEAVKEGIDPADLLRAVQAYATESEGFTRSKVCFADNWFQSRRWQAFIERIEAEREAAEAVQADHHARLVGWIRDRSPMCKHITAPQVKALVAAGLVTDGQLRSAGLAA